MSFNMYVPTRFVFGNGRLSELSQYKMPGKKAMIVTTNGTSVFKNGAYDNTVEQLNKAGVASVLFNEVQANPLKSTVMNGAAFVKENQCDFIVALGGGSVMDAAKAMAFMATNPGDLWDYIVGGSGKGQPMQEKPLPIVCITTTAGTGSEADQWGVISHDERNEKIGFGGWDELFPVLSIIDPELMKTVPPKFTAYQGFDALFHATECYISKGANMMSDMYALTAIENIASYLARAVKDGNDIEAREHVAFANTLSGIVMTICSTTAEHSIEHALSAFHPSLPHGAGLIMISWAYHEAYAPSCPERYARVAAAMGQEASVDGFLNGLNKLKEACGVDKLKMSEFGITPDLFDEYAKTAFSTMGNLFELDRCKLTPADVVSILEKSYS